MSRTLAAALVLAVVGCKEPSRPNETLGNAGGAKTSPDEAWMYIPGDAVIAWFESPMPVMIPLPERSAECQAKFMRLDGFRAERPGERQVQILLGDIPREAFTRCLVEGGNISAEIGGGPKVVATTEGDFTRLGAFWIGWHGGFVIISEGEAPSRTDAPRMVRELLGAKEALWTRLPIAKAVTGVPAAELMVRLDTWELTNTEWERTIAGTLQIRFNSAAEATLAATKLSSGTISTIRDPALLRVLASAKAEVVDTTLRLRLTTAVIPFGTLLDELSPITRSP